jgi:transposase
MTPSPRSTLEIDVGKDDLALALLIPSEALHAEDTLHTKSVRNDAVGHRALVRWLGRFTDDLAFVRACLEASGGYEEDAAVALHQAGLTISVVNPRRTAAYADVQQAMCHRRCRSKTGRADAALLACFCQRERPDARQPPAPEVRGLRRLTRAADALRRDRDRTRNRRDGMPPGPARQALTSVLLAYAEQIKALEAAISAHVAAHPESERQRDLLVSIPGVGKQTAAVVLAELGDASAFASVRSVAAYAGLVPRHHESGRTVSKRPRLSKVGNARLRRALYFPALSAMRYNAAVKVFAERLPGRGKANGDASSPMAVVGASMRKLVRICYGVLKSERPFDASLHPTT